MKGTVDLELEKKIVEAYDKSWLRKYYNLYRAGFSYRLKNDNGEILKDLTPKYMLKYLISQEKDWED